MLNKLHVASFVAFVFHTCSFCGTSNSTHEYHRGLWISHSADDFFSYVLHSLKNKKNKKEEENLPCPPQELEVCNRSTYIHKKRSDRSVLTVMLQLLRFFLGPPKASPLTPPFESLFILIYSYFFFVLFLKISSSLYRNGQC